MISFEKIIVYLFQIYSIFGLCRNLDKVLSDNFRCDTKLKNGVELGAYCLISLLECDSPPNYKG